MPRRSHSDGTNINSGNGGRVRSSTSNRTTRLDGPYRITTTTRRQGGKITKTTTKKDANGFVVSKVTETSYDAATPQHGYNHFSSTILNGDHLHVQANGRTHSTTIPRGGSITTTHRPTGTTIRASSHGDLNVSTPGSRVSMSAGGMTVAMPAMRVGMGSQGISLRMGGLNMVNGNLVNSGGSGGSGGRGGGGGGAGGGAGGHGYGYGHASSNGDSEGLEGTGFVWM